MPAFTPRSLPGLQPSSIDERIRKICECPKINAVRKYLPRAGGGVKGKEWTQVFSEDWTTEDYWNFTTIYHRINGFGYLELGTNDGVTYNHPCLAYRKAVDLTAYDGRIDLEICLSGATESLVNKIAFGDDIDNWNGVVFNNADPCIGVWICKVGTYYYSVDSLNDSLERYTWYRRRLEFRVENGVYTTYWKKLVDSVWTTLSSRVWSGVGDANRRWDDSNLGIIEKYTSDPAYFRNKNYSLWIYT